MSNLIKKIQNTAFQNNLWKRGSKIVLGVSGGPDSVFLLDILSGLAPKYDLKLIIAHVNYGLRGPDSQKDESFVRKLAAEYKIPVFTLTSSPSPKGRKGSGLPSENTLRDIRYEFFEKIRKQNNFDSIAVAHNLDDQVETFLMRVIRGAGLQGLSAMKYKNGKIIRPLLGISRWEILEHLQKKNMKYRIDKTNKADIFFRNKVRNNLIPYLEKNFNPKIKETIFDSLASIAEDQTLIEDIAGENYRKSDFHSVKNILKLHPSLQRRILRKMIAEKIPSNKDIQAGHIEEVLKALRSTKGKNQVVVFRGLKMVRKGDKVTISKLNN